MLLHVESSIQPLVARNGKQGKLRCITWDVKTLVLVGIVGGHYRISWKAFSMGKLGLGNQSLLPRGGVWVPGDGVFGLSCRYGEAG